MTPGTVTVLRSWRKQQTEERLRLGEAYQDSGLVFTDEGGGGYLPGSVSQAFDRLVVQAGVRRCRFPAGRRTAAEACGGVVARIEWRPLPAGGAFSMPLFVHMFDPFP